VAKFVRAYEPSDVDALVEQLTDDVLMSMPPMPFAYEGRLPVVKTARQTLPRRRARA
jgi:ketosteroid isomerase-like protein